MPSIITDNKQDDGGVKMITDQRCYNRQSGYQFVQLKMGYLQLVKTIPIRQITSASLNRVPGLFSIRGLADVLKGQDLIHDLHKHDFYFLLIIFQGSGTHEIDFVKYPVHDHSVFILRPGQVHQLKLSKNTTGFLIEFDLSFYKPQQAISEHRWRKASGKNFCEVEAVRFMKLQSYLENILEEYTLKQDGYPEAIKANLDLFFIEYTRQSSEPASVNKNDNGYVQERFETFTALLEKHAANVKNVAQYAAMLNLSPYQLNAITKATVGKTVSTLIDEQVILEAKRYLLATSHQVKEIADKLGYEDASYFIRFFKKHTGQAPDLFRRNFK